MNLLNWITLPPVSPADDWVQPLVDSLKMPTDQVKYFVNCLIGPFLCILFRYLPNNPTLKHVLFGMLGFIASYLLFGLEVFTVFYTAIPVYIIMYFSRTKKAANICFLIVFGYLTVRNIYLYFTQYLVWALDYTATHMVLTLKMTAFAWSVANGNGKKDLPKYLEQHKVVKYPNPLEYFGFVFFYPGMFSGPSLEYNDYMDYVTMKRFEQLGGKLPKIPMFSFLKHYIGGVVILLTYAFINSNPPPTPQYYILEHPEECGVLFKLMTIWIHTTIMKYKYFGVWKLTEGMGEASACGYTGTTSEGKDEFLLYKNCNLVKFEISRSVKVSMDLWNTYVQHWLKNYVYISMIGTIFDKYKTTLTMLVTAIYHGVYPGYYITFLTLGFHKNLSTLIYKRLDPYMEEKFGKGTIGWKIYDVCLRIFVHWHSHYTVLPFMIFEFTTSLIAYARTYFLGILIPVAVYIWLKKFPPKMKSKVEKKEQ